MASHTALAASTPDQNHEAHLKATFPGMFPHYMGPYSDPCLSCGAIHWKCERTGNNQKAPRVSYSMCCQKGHVSIPATYSGSHFPCFLQNLLSGTDTGMFNFS
jgi:hypothetical protein